MNKKLIVIISAAALLVVIALVVGLAACNGNNNNENESGSDPEINIPDESGESDDSNSDEGESNENTAPDPGELEYNDADGFVFVMNVNASEIPVRSGNFEWLGTVKVGEKLERLGVSTDERWTKIKYNNDVAYVATRNLTTYDKDSNGFVAVDKEIVLTQNMNIRTSPQVPNGTKNDAESSVNVIGQLEKGTTVKVIAEDTNIGWYKIEYTPATAPDVPTVEGYTYEYFVKIMDADEEGNEEDSSESEESSSEIEAENKENAEAAGK